MPSETSVRKHEKACIENKAQQIIMPKPGECVRFKSYKKLLRAYFTTYFDFECILKDSKYIPCQFSIFCPDLGVLRIECSDNPQQLMKEFWDILFEINKRAKEKIDNPVPANFTVEDKKKYEEAKTCWICGKRFGEDAKHKYCYQARLNTIVDYYDKIYDDVTNYDKVPDHDHLTGKYRGAAHRICNLNLNYKHYKIPVFAHNGSGFDFNFIFKYLPDNIRIHSIKQTIAKSFEKITSFEIGPFKFIDSYQHLKFSIDGLSSILDKSNAYHYVKEYIHPDFHHLVKRKLKFPYEWLDDFNKLFTHTCLL